MNVENVAIYLRKSRGEIEDLEKHKGQLIELANRNKWKYDIYEEIGTSDSIIKRKEFKKLLDLIEEDKYSKLMVVALDRLSRNERNQAEIFELLQEHDVEIVTPSKIYNLNSENDLLMSDFEKLLARQEFRLIKKRLRQGKKNGAKLGRWTNGTPPIPYIYDRANQKLMVNKEQYKIYRLIIQKALEGYSTNYIAFQLNKMNIRSPYGYVWHNNTIARILVDKTQLGKIVYNGEEYTGLHESVKTLEEHQKILLFLKKRTLNANRKPLTHIYILNGLIKCGKCGHTMTTYRRAKSGTYTLKKCWYKSPLGEVCNNKGSTIEIIIDNIKSALNQHIFKLQEELDKGEEEISSKLAIESELDILKSKYSKFDKKIDKVKEMILEEIYDTKEGKNIIQKIENDKSELLEEIKLLQSQLVNLNNINKKQNIINAKDALNALYNNSNESEVNKILKTVIKNIIWTREEDNIDIDIEFL